MTDELRKLCAENVRDMCHIIFQAYIAKTGSNRQSFNDDLALIFAAENKLTHLSDLESSIKDSLTYLVDNGYISNAVINIELTDEGNQAYNELCDKEIQYIDNILEHLKPAECAMINIVSDLLKNAFSVYFDKSEIELAIERE